jgi:hypothetical protein
LFGDPDPPLYLRNPAAGSAARKSGDMLADIGAIARLGRGRIQQSQHGERREAARLQIWAHIVE